ncbi:MAG: hypothetical protein ACRENP_17770 [Longimicrobiales bacterium]
MHLVLTDWLTCPHCGPHEGLIVLAERIVNRRILEGALGCPACQRQFSVRNGEADLRTDTDSSFHTMTAAATAEDARRLAALLGLTEGHGYAVLMGAATDRAAELAELVPGLELIAINARAAQPTPGVSLLRADTVLPLRSSSVRGVVVSEGAPTDLHEEVLRVLAPGARLVISTALPAAQALADSNEARTLARDAQHIVLARAH